MIRTLIDLFDCEKTQLNAIQCHWSLVTEIIKTEHLEVVLGIRTAHTDPEDGVEQHVTNAILEDGYIHLVTQPSLKHAAIDIWRPTHWPVENLLHLLQRTFKPGRVKVFCRDPENPDQDPTGD